MWCGYDKKTLTPVERWNWQATSRKLFNKREMLKLMRTPEWIEIYALVTLHCAFQNCMRVGDLQKKSALIIKINESEQKLEKTREEINLFEKLIGS